MKKKLQLIALSILLVAVMVGGVWLLTRSPGEKAPDTSDDPAISQPETPGQPDQTTKEPIPITEPVTRKVGCKILQDETQDILLQLNSRMNCLFQVIPYQGQPCVFELERPDRFSPYQKASLISLVDGQALAQLSGEELPFNGEFEDLILSDQGEIWGLQWEYAEDAETVTVPGLWLSRVGEEQPRFFLTQNEAYEHDHNVYAIQNGLFCVLTCDNFAPDSLQTLEVFDLETQEPVLTLEGVNTFCFDKDGVLYYFVHHETETWGEIAAYDLAQRQELWRTELEGIWADGIMAGAEKGCYFRGNDEGAIYWLDPDSKTASEVMNMTLDLDNVPEKYYKEGRLYYIRYDSFAVDAENRVYQLMDDALLMPPDMYARRSILITEPVYRTITPEDRVILTVTSPYVPENIEQALPVFYRRHPEIEVVWDTQYSSRKVLRENSLVYKEQITLRVMTGDVGDIVMVSGSGLDEDILTGTDAFADLSGYLEACPFREQLNPAPLEALRGEDGAVRAVPISLACNSIGFLLNRDLLEQLGNPIDPETVTWSELLKLAKQWKDEGKEFSLMAGDDRPYLEEVMLSMMLLANLYGANGEGEAGSLDQSYLRELLELWKELQGTSYLTRTDMDATKALYTMPDLPGPEVQWIVYPPYDRMPAGMPKLYLSPIPKGEVWKKQQGYAFCWGISNSSPNKDAAWTLLEYLISENGLFRHRYTTDTLVWNTAAQERKFEEYYDWFQYHKDEYDLELFTENFRKAQEILSQPFSRLSEKYGWYQAVHDPIVQYLNDQLTLDQAMSQASDNWARLLLE